MFAEVLEDVDVERLLEVVGADRRPSTLGSENVESPRLTPMNSEEQTPRRSGRLRGEEAGPALADRQRVSRSKVTPRVESLITWVGQSFVASDGFPRSYPEGKCLPDPEKSRTACESALA